MSRTDSTHRRSWLRIAVITAMVATALFAAPTASAVTTCTVGSGGYVTIQDAINDTGCDEITVPAGTYYENLTIARNVAINGAGADLTTIDGGGSTTVYTNGVDSSTTLDGFTITNDGNWPAAIYNEQSSPTITNNTIAGSLNGIMNGLSSPTITNNIITGNRHGIYNVYHSSPTITNNIITDNGERGIYNYSDSSPTITNNTIAGNGHQGIYNASSYSVTITNNIITGNGYGYYGPLAGIECSVGSGTIDYNNVWGNARDYSYCGPGPNDISEDPLFVGPGDYHLQPTSPCIDVGSNAAPALPSNDFEGDPRILDGDGDSVAVVDMGADEYLVPNLPPVADANGPYSGFEGAEVMLDGSGSYDPNTSTGDSIVSYEWDLDDDGLFDDATGETVLHVFGDDGNYPIGLEVTDTFGATDTNETTVSVANVAPTVESVSVPSDPIPIGTPVPVIASFSDPAGTDDEPYTCDVDYGETTKPGNVSGYECSASHAYAEAGIYTIEVSVTDKDGGVGTGTAETLVVVYDPDGGFVTGGGWIDSPEGAYMPDPSLTGKATFGFVSKYKKGAEVPTGSTEFQFHAGDLNFHSTSYNWLVVTGSDYAMFKGVGTINGVGEYKFRIWAGDGEPDTFRIKIWTEDGGGVETVIYDNGSDQAIDGGSIVIHVKKK